ncbi:MAG: 2-oxoglutarate dehydrogenase E1 component [Myxococcota bacterium]
MDPAVHNLAFVEELYEQYLDDPKSVAPDWSAYFEQWADQQRKLSNGNPVQVGPSFLPRSIFNPPASGTVSGAVERESRNQELPPLADFTRGVPSGPAAARGLPPYDPDSADARRAFLKSLTLFKELSEGDLDTLLPLAEDVHYEAGQAIVREGEVGSDLFVITQGVVEVRRRGQLFVSLGVGEVLGEMSVFDGQPRSADVVASTGVHALRLSGSDVTRAVVERPAVARKILQVLSQRLRETSTRQDRVDQLIRAYRVRGHLLAQLDPLGFNAPQANPELNPSYYGFEQDDLDLVFSSTTIPGRSTMTLREILRHLHNTYCRFIGVQFMHIDDLQVKMWLQDRMETSQNVRRLSREEQLRILTKLTDAEAFEQFIHKKFIGAKRFSLEGAESLIPLLDLAIEEAGERGVREIVLGMAHRGRLNVLANVIGKSPHQIFREFDDQAPDSKFGRGDVKYHLGHSSDYVTSSGNKVHISLSFNPSHLEFVNPVVMGRIRAKQDRHHDVHRNLGLGILIHGDASFAGQGVVQETLNMSALEGYRTGGILHIILNNQIGFTTNPTDGRSTQYATDVAKMLQVPIIHVNGEHPEAVAQAVHLALEFRETFSQDVVIDMYCYRRYGHNEGDEPSFTQPGMYEVIRNRKSVRDGYLDNLYEMGNVTSEEADRIAVERRDRLEAELGIARQEPTTQDMSSGQGFWKGFQGGRDADTPTVDTSLSADELSRLLTRLTELPHDFEPHPKLKRILSMRREMAEGHRELDWSAGEALAYASLLHRGTRIRLTGQDSERGTFSHRHSVLHDYKTGRELNVFSLIEGGTFEVRNSPLSETGALGFEYGYSLDYPEALVVWEAQFGDFINGAQVIVDQFVTSGEDKWRRLSGLVLLLPHGFEGQGPEHSSARLERFLVAAAEDNIQVCNFTTPAQFFHALRRQVIRPFRKPLVVMSPKSLLRHPKATSPLSEFADRGFQRIIPDVQPIGSEVRRVLLCSGKVYYELEERREQLKAHDVALIRVEQLYPLHDTDLMEVLDPYPQGTEVVWVQEEPANMGAWAFFKVRFGETLHGRHPFRSVTRQASASPATGSAAAHKVEQERLMEAAFEPSDG